MRISNLFALVESLVIVVLGVLFYTVFNEQYKIISLVALGCYLAEAITKAVAKIGAYALIPLSLKFVEAGAPVASYFQTLGDFLYSGVFQLGNDIHMWFYCLGGLLWFYLFHRSRYIPRVMSVFGLVIVSLGLIGMVLTLFGVNTGRVFLFPILPLELITGVWLIIKVIRDGSETN